jgi:DnaJ-class molecular chaperone
MLRWIVAIYLIANVHAWIINIHPSLAINTLPHRRLQQFIVFKSKRSDNGDGFDVNSSGEEEGSATSKRTLQENESFMSIPQEECWDLCPTMDDEDDEVLRDPSKFKSGQLSHSHQLVVTSTQEREIQIERDRIRLEMAYRLFESRDDCDLDDISTCASTCQECHGVGYKPCRFCAGTKSIQLPGATNALPCPVCNQKGVEVCTNCRGSGKVASWTDLAKFNPEKV